MINDSKLLGVIHFRGPIAEVFVSTHTLHIAITCTHFLFMSSTQKFNVFSILTKQLSHCAHNFYSLRCDSKASTNFFFLLHDFTSKNLFLTINLSNLSILFFLPLLSQELSPLHLKELLYGCFKISKC